MPLSEISEINEKIFGKGKEYNLIDVYHYLMSSYGYISFDDFVKMDASLVDELMTRINKDNEKAAPSGKRGKF